MPLYPTRYHWPLVHRYYATKTINTMRKTDLIDRLTIQHRTINPDTIQRSVNVLLDHISETLAQGGRIEIRGFGSSALNDFPPRQGRNPKTGERLEVPDRYRIHFKAAKALRQRVNSASQKSESVSQRKHPRNSTPAFSDSRFPLILLLESMSPSWSFGALHRQERP